MVFDGEVLEENRSKSKPKAGQLEPHKLLDQKRSDMELPQEVRETVDVTAITQLILRERESRGLGRWERMRGCFWPESLVRVSWFRGSGPDFVEGSIDMAQRGVLAKHRLAPILVTLRGARAIASLAAIIDLPVS